MPNDGDDQIPLKFQHIACFIKRFPECSSGKDIFNSSKIIGKKRKKFSLLLSGEACFISNKRQSEVVIKLTTMRNHGVYSILD